MITLLNGRSPNADDILDDEYGKALSCQERAYFFSSSLPPISTSTTLNEPDIDPRFIITTGVYREARDILLTRFEEVKNQYQKLLNRTKPLRIFGIRAPDRNYNFTLQSKNIVNQRFSDLINSLDSTPSPRKGDADKYVEKYCAVWSGLNNIIVLFMEEISFLCKRIESLQSLVNTTLGWGISLAIFFLGQFLSHAFQKHGTESPLINQTIVQQYPKNYLTPSEIQNVAQELNNLSKEFSIANSKTTELYRSIADLNSNLQKPITINLSESNFSTISDLTTKNNTLMSTNFQKLETAINNINSSFSTNNAVLSTNLPHIVTGVGSITNSVNKVKSAIDDKKVTPIDINSIPKQRTKVLGIPISTTEAVPAQH